MLLMLLFCSFFTPKDSLLDVHTQIHASLSDAGQTPFWLRSLQYGQIQSQSPGLGALVSLKKKYAPNRKYGFSYGIEANVWVGKKNDLFLSEAYIGGKRGRWELWMGLQKEVYGLGDSTLSSGFYAWSGNALPLPKIKLGTRDYLPVFRNFIGVHMTYSHGWLDNMGALKGALLHQKSLYMRLGKPSSRLNLFGGLNHQVQWAGEKKVYSSYSRAINQYPNSLSTYFYVVTVLKNRTIVPLDPLTTSDDMENQFGNHLGSIDVAMRYRLRSGTLLFYKQTGYETGQVFSLVTADDGLTGISYAHHKPAWVDHATFEFLYTGNQGSYISWIGKMFNVVDSHFGEVVSPFYNGARSSGWTYSGNEIGTPLLMVDAKTSLNTGDTFTFNAVKSYYLGLKGHILPAYAYQLRASKSSYSYVRAPNYSRPANPPVVNQFSSSFSLIHPLKDGKSQWTASLGYDQGDMIPGNVGLLFSYSVKLN